MRSWILIVALAAVMLNVAFTLPVNLEDTEGTKVSDEELLKLLEGKSNEIDTDTDSSDLTRRRRSASDGSNSSSGEKNKEQKKEQDPNDTSSASTEEHTDEPAKAHSARRKRAAPEGEEALDETLDTKDASNVDETDELHVENPEDYAQGCEVLEVNSKEANNETFLE